MLPLKSRVKKDLFPKIMKEGSFLHGGSFYLRLLDRKDSLPAIFAFVVPNKVKKTSVGRHLIKRKMSAVVEKLLITIKSGYSVILLAKKDVFTLSYKEIEKDILELLNKAKLIV